MLFLFFPFIFVSFVQSANITVKEYARLPPVFDSDNFDRCLLFDDEALHCYIELHLKPINPEEPSETWIHIRDLSSDLKNYRHDKLRYGVCIPISCPQITKKREDPGFKSDLTECMNNKYKHLGVHGTIEYMNCQTAEAPKFDLLDITVAILLVAYILFIIFASFYEGLARYKTSKEYEEATTSKYGRILACFSIPYNWDKLKKIEWTEDNKKFKFIQGIRFYNMLIVISVHASVSSAASLVSNTKFLESVFERPYTIFLTSGPYGVSTFFQLSAMLLTYSLWTEFGEKSNKKLDIKTVLWILLYRYFRLTPAVAVIMAIHSTLLNHTGRGPMWDEFIGIDRRNCRGYSWSNLLYVSNWINAEDMCLIQNWYLSVDMQGFILVLGLLYFTIKRPKRFLWCLISAWTLNHIYIAFYLYRNSLFHFVRPYPENTFRFKGIYETNGIWAKTLGSTPMNLASTIIGTGLGYVIYKYEKLPVFNIKVRFLIWTFAIYGVALGIIVFPGIWLYSKDYYDSFWFSIPYLTLGPTIYCLALALAIFGFASGQGWASKWVLEFPPIYYLGRLSYATFLAHYPVVYYSVASNKSLQSLDVFNIVFSTGKIFAVSLFFGLILSLTVEYPISGVSSLLLKREIMDKNKNIKEIKKNK